MPLTPRDAEALTYLARRLRAETYGAARWDDAGINAKISELIGQNLAISIERVVRHAADPNAKTPGAILRPFTPAPVAQTLGSRSPRRDQECPHHPGQWNGNCGPCATEGREAAPTRRPPAPAERRETTARYLAEARAQLTHPDHCTDHGHPAAETEGESK